MMVSSCRRRKQIGFHHLLDRLDDKQRTSIFHQISDLGADLHHAPGVLGTYGRVMKLFTTISSTRPAYSELMVVNNFMTSMIQSGWPACTTVPI